MDSSEYFNIWSILSLLILMVGLIAIWIHRRIQIMTVLKRNGIPGNVPHLIFGNLFQIKRSGLPMMEYQRKQIERYGKIVGNYTGAKPNILVADPELAKRILIKDFNNFINRPLWSRYAHPVPEIADSLFLVRDQRWRQLRGLMTPAFSASKLKGMTPIMESSVDTFLGIIDKKYETGKEFNIFELYKKLILEMIMKTSFGVEFDAQNDNNSSLLKNSQLFLLIKMNKFILLLFICFPELSLVIDFWKRMSSLISNYLGVTPLVFLWNTCSQIIKVRKSEPDMRRNDLLQAMIDTEYTEEGMSDVLSERSKRNTIKLTEDEITINCITSLVAGYDTSSTVLGFVTHRLINYPEIQERVRKEILEVNENEGQLDYNSVNKLQYMEWVINETLRHNPPLVNSSTRECAKDYKYGNITIPKGATIMVCTHVLQKDPDYWSEPDVFDPLRFSPERRHEIKAGTYLPFGDGLRNCIGGRLAYIQLKLTLAKLLLKYKLESGPHSEIGELALRYKQFSVVPKNGVFVKAVNI